MIVITKDNGCIQFGKIIENLEKEKEYLDCVLGSQERQKEVFLVYMQKFVDSNENIEENNIEKMVNVLEEAKNAIECVNNNVVNLTDIINLYNQVKYDLNDQNFETYLNDLNEKYIEILKSVTTNTIRIQECLNDLAGFSNIYNVQESSSKINNIDEVYTKEEITEKIEVEEEQKLDMETEVQDVSDLYKIDLREESNIEMPIKNVIQETEMQEKVIDTKIQNSKEENIEEPNLIGLEDYKENTLLISETSGKVVLPFLYKDIEREMRKHPNKYTCVESVIAKKYMKSIDYYKNAPVMRFKEAFRLARKKENKSLVFAFDLGMELLFSYNLHPAIISACKTVDELDIYLDYLEDNQTGRFECFEIEFEIAPVIRRRKKSLAY